MALSAAQVWEVRTTGSDTLNSGGFKAGASGTDYSRQDAVQFSGTDLVVDATTNTKVTSATHNFVAADVGNLVQITAGAGWTTGFYEIVSVASNAATLDRSPAAVGTTGGTWAEGGALASLGGIQNKAVASNTIWIKSGAYTFGNGTVNTSGNSPAFTQFVNIYIEGYGTTRGDLGTKPTFVPATPASWPANQAMISVGGGRIANIEINTTNGTNAATSIGLNSSSSAHIYRVISRNATNRGINPTGDSFCEECLVDNTSFYNGANGIICVSCVAINGGTFAGSVGRASAYINCIAYKSGTKASATAFAIGGSGSPVAKNCVAYNYTTGFDCGTTPAIFNSCIASTCTTGFSASSSTNAPVLRNCAGWNNSVNVSANILQNVGFVALTSDPFTDTSVGDFSLNNTAGGGAACRAAGLPGVFPGGLTTGYPDIGAVQSQASGVSGGLLLNSGMVGGLRG